MRDDEVAKLEFFGWKMADELYKKQIAFKVIKRFASISKAIPDELIPYLNEACDYFIDNPGNAVSNSITASNWSNRIFDVEVLRQCGYTVENACKAIVARDGDTYMYSSLFAKRRGEHPCKDPKHVTGFMRFMFEQGSSLGDIEKFTLRE